MNALITNVAIWCGIVLLCLFTIWLGVMMLYCIVAFIRAIINDENVV